MSSPVQILHADRIPSTGCLVIPGRLGPHELSHLEKLFAGRKITWFIEESSKLDPAIRAHLERSGSGAAFSEDEPAPAESAQDETTTDETTPDETTSDETTTEDETSTDETTSSTQPTLQDDNPFILNPFDNG